MLLPDGTISIEFLWTQRDWMTVYQQVGMRTWKSWWGLPCALTSVVLGLSFEAFGPLVAFCGVLLAVWNVAIVWIIGPLRRSKMSQEGPVAHMFATQGVASRSGVAESRTSWKAYSAIGDVPSFVILHQPGNRIIPLPKKAFSSPTELEHLRAMARHGIEGG